MDVPDPLPSWKEKILDYEIETRAHCPSVYHRLHLKRKDSRLRDWNRWWRARRISKIMAWKEKILDYEIETLNRSLNFISSPIRCLEKKRFSITRLKPVEGHQQASDLLRLKRKDSRLRDWNTHWAGLSAADPKLEKKRFSITRLKPGVGDFDSWRGNSWKEKILDYEIETLRDDLLKSLPLLPLEKKRFSITRLKHRSLFHLDIITISHPLEKKRFSITRLKQSDLGCSSPKSTETWKEKILDYEIETISTVDMLSVGWSFRSFPWKEKILDYEIETFSCRCDWDAVSRNLKRKDSRLRDWNLVVSVSESVFLCFCLKRKDSRLRDWNNDDQRRTRGIQRTWKEKILDYEIETFVRVSLSRRALFSWKEKILDYEIETLRSCLSALETS